MSDYEYDIPMPKDQMDCLTRLVELAKENKVCTLLYFDNFADDGKGYIFNFSVGKVDEQQLLLENPFPGFEVLGLVTHIGKEKVFLTPKAFEWAAYQKKSRLGKWIARLPGNVKDLMIAFSFLVSLAVAIVELLRALKALP